MLEQLFFIFISIILFGIIFFKIIKKNDTSYVLIIAIETIGIAIDLVFLLSNWKMNIIIKIIEYLMSVILPLAIIILEMKNIDIIHHFKGSSVDIFILTGNYKKAKEILMKIIEKNEENYDAHKKLAKIYEKEGGIRKAVDEYTQCISINKQDYDSYYKISTLLVELDRKEDAIQMLDSLLSKQPENYQATMDLGDLLMEFNRYKDAANLYLDAIKMHPENYDLYYNLGMVYTMLNDFNNAKECYEKAAEINSLAYNSKYSLAEIALLYKDLDKAEKYFMELIDNEEFSADSYYELSKINLIKGNKDLAINYANLAIDLDSKKIAEKIKREPLFMTIMTKISIPFNLEEKSDSGKLTEKEKIVKKHLEDTQELTTNMGYGIEKEDEELEKENDINDLQK